MKNGIQLVEPYNNATIKLSNSIDAAITAYFMGGFINPALVIGLLEDKKRKVYLYADAINAEIEFKEILNPPSYVG